MSQPTKNPDEDFERFLRNITTKLADLKDPVSKLEKLSTEKEKKKWLKGEEEKLVRYFTKELQRLMEMVKPVPDMAKTLPATTQDQRPREKQKDVVAQGSPKPGKAEQIKPSTSSTPPQTAELAGSDEQQLPKQPKQKATEPKSSSTAMKKSAERNDPGDGSSLKTLDDRRVKELDECYAQIQKLEKKYNDKKQEAEETAKKRDDISNEYSVLKKEFEALGKRKHEAEKERDAGIATLKKTVQELKEGQEKQSKYLHDELRKSQESRDKKDTKIRKLEDNLREHETTEREQKQKIEKLKAEKNDWMNKFGKLASDKVESSPDVTDLGDPDRALKLAERYKDVYDNIWTKTYRAQIKLKKFHEEDIVKNLLDILTGAFNYCEELAQAQESSLKNLLLHPNQEDISAIQIKQIDIKPHQQQKMKELRKQLAMGATAVEEVKQAYLASELKKLERSQSEGGYDKADLNKRMDVSKDFYRKCVEVCWPMVLHEPPLYLEVNIKRGDPCDRDLYTMRSEGDQVKTLVWPPLFQGKGGGLLAQGVVEGQKSVKRSDV